MRYCPNIKVLNNQPQQETSQQFPSHLSLSQWSMSQQVVIIEHSFLDSQQEISLVVEQPNNPIDNRINKFFIFVFILLKVYAKLFYERYYIHIPLTDIDS